VLSPPMRFWFPPALPCTADNRLGAFRLPFPALWTPKGKFV